MSDSETTLAKIIDLIEYRLGQNITNFADPAQALDSILCHEAASGRIPRHGQHWISEEDRKRIATRTYGIEPSGYVLSAVLMQFLAESERCESGQQFTAMVVNVLIQTSDHMMYLQKRLIDGLNLTPVTQFISLNGP